MADENLCCPWGMDEWGACIGKEENGHLECLVIARQNGCTWDENTFCSAVSLGSIECLIYLKENGCPWDENCWSDAAINVILFL